MYVAHTQVSLSLSSLYLNLQIWSIRRLDAPIYEFETDIFFLVCSFLICMMATSAPGFYIIRPSIHPFQRYFFYRVYAEAYVCIQIGARRESWP